MGVGGLHELLLDEEKLEVDEEMHYVTMLYDAAGEWRVESEKSYKLLYKRILGGDVIVPVSSLHSYCTIRTISYYNNNFSLIHPAKNYMRHDGDFC